jgi:hypothetical protein
MDRMEMALFFTTYYTSSLAIHVIHMVCTDRVLHPHSSGPLSRFSFSTALGSPFHYMYLCETAESDMPTHIVDCVSPTLTIRRGTAASCVHVIYHMYRREGRVIYFDRTSTVSRTRIENSSILKLLLAIHVFSRDLFCSLAKIYTA